MSDVPCLGSGCVHSPPARPPVRAGLVPRCETGIELTAGSQVELLIDRRTGNPCLTLTPDSAERSDVELIAALLAGPNTRRPFVEPFLATPEQIVEQAQLTSDFGPHRIWVASHPSGDDALIVQHPASGFQALPAPDPTRLPAIVLSETTPGQGTSWTSWLGRVPSGVHSALVVNADRSRDRVAVDRGWWLLDRLDPRPRPRLLIARDGSGDEVARMPIP